MKNNTYYLHLFNHSNFKRIGHLYECISNVHGMQNSRANHQLEDSPEYKRGRGYHSQKLIERTIQTTKEKLFTKEILPG